MEAEANITVCINYFLVSVTIHMTETTYEREIWYWLAVSEGLVYWGRKSMGTGSHPSPVCTGSDSESTNSPYLKRKTTGCGGTHLLSKYLGD